MQEAEMDSPIPSPSSRAARYNINTHIRLRFNRKFNGAAILSEYIGIIMLFKKFQCVITIIKGVGKDQRNL